jgi:excisionase family DNA binding protein
MSAPLLLPIPQAAQELGLGRDLAYRLVNEGRLKSVSFDGRKLVPRIELEAFVAREVDCQGESAAAERS